MPQKTKKYELNKDKAGEIMIAIEELTKELRYPPSRRQIQERLGYSSTSILQYWLERMRDAGYIIWDRGISKSLVITKKGQYHKPRR